VTLARQKFCQQGACAASSQNEDPHRAATLSHPSSRTTAARLPGNSRLHSVAHRARPAVLLTIRKPGRYDFCDIGAERGRLIPFIALAPCRVE
jgi:hypothetical protein